MKQNVGNADRIIRISIGLALIAFLVLTSDATRWWGLLGFIPLLTAFTGNCPLYTIAGINTCGVTRR